MKERIQKVLADAGVESRRHIEEMVRQGRIAVNGRLVTTLPVMIDPEHDQVTVDGDVVRFAKREHKPYVYVLMNKPKHVYCTNVAQGEQKRAIDLLPPDFDTRVYPVGRLDADSRGLLLLTNDGELTQQLTHPRFGVAKTYTCVVDGFIQEETLKRLQEGVWLSDDEGGGGFKTAKSHIKIIRRAGENSVLQITIKEGRNRQIRRIFARVGHKLRELTRVKLGPLELGTLKPGQSRLLTGREVEKLRNAAKPKTAASATPAKPPRKPALRSKARPAR